MSIRVRFAPSPTGLPHLGNIRSALFNWLFAKKMGGEYILRVEDTDQTRLVPGSLEAIYDSLKWLGLNWDEGPEVGGDYGPYIQSERLDLYKKKARELVENKQAYYCFCSEERLKNLRAEQEANKLPPKYDGHCRCLTQEEIEAKLKNGTSFVIRQLVPNERMVKTTDLVQGDVDFKAEILDDSVLLKSDGFPTYHLANVVDDIAMKITHVIRGVEWLPSLPKHILLYESFNEPPPQFAHLPLILGADKSKLSKRHGAKNILELKEEGFVPAGVINALALLGWSPQKEHSDAKEVLAVEEIIKKFSLEATQKSPAIFDEKKLLHFNFEHLKNLPIPDYVSLWQKFLPELDLNEAAVRVVSDRAQTLRQATEIILTLTKNYQQPDEVLLAKKAEQTSVSEILAWWKEWLGQKDKWSASTLRQEALNDLENNNFKRGEYLWPLRVAITGQENSPEVFACLEYLGKETSLVRL